MPDFSYVAFNCWWTHFQLFSSHGCIFLVLNNGNMADMIYFPSGHFIKFKPPPHSLKFPMLYALEYFFVVLSSYSYIHIKVYWKCVVLFSGEFDRNSTYESVTFFFHPETSGEGSARSLYVALPPPWPCFLVFHVQTHPGHKPVPHKGHWGVPSLFICL